MGINWEMLSSKTDLNGSPQPLTISLRAVVQPNAARTPLLLRAKVLPWGHLRYTAYLTACSSLEADAMPPFKPRDIVPDPVYHRFWDFIGQGAANIFDRGGHPELARKIEQGRANPNEDRMAKEAVAAGWRHWLGHSRYTDLTAAIRRDLNERMPTLLGVRVEHVLGRPISRAEVEVYLAQWFHGLRCGLSLTRCRLAAHELSDSVLHAALDKDHAALHETVRAALDWDALHRVAEPVASARVTQARDLARALANEAAHPLLSAAHLFYGIAALAPAMRPQQTLSALGMWPARVAVAVRQLSWKRLVYDPRIGAVESPGLHAMLDDAVVVARDARAKEFSDEHLLWAALGLAVDPTCVDGESLRVIFGELSLDVRQCVAALQTASNLRSGYFL